MRWRPSPFTTLSLSMAFAVVANMATGTVPIRSVPATVGVWTAVGALAVASIIAELARAGQDSTDPSARLAAVADRLAQALRARLRHDEECRKVTDPISLPVRWHPVDDGLIDHWSNIRGTALGEPAAALLLAGRIDQIAAVYRGIPSGRLVILGPPGSGKSVLAGRLAMDLLDARELTDPVPYLVHIGSWNPAEPLREWLAAQLVRDQPGLAAAHPEHRNLAAALITGDLILPILDGFDEISPELHRVALDQLNTVSRMRLVLTSRPDQYAAAVRQTDVLTAAAGVVLEELTLEDLAHYLPRTTRRTGTDPAERGGWQEVLDRLRAAGPDSPAALTEALSTPLMVYLARTIYSDLPGRTPADLLDGSRFPTALTIQDHLLAAYLPAVYRHPAATGRIWPADRAQHWLSYLARHLDALGVADLEWWRMRETVPRATRILMLGTAALLVIGLALGPSWGTGSLCLGVVVGIMFGPVAGSRSSGPGPTRVRFTLHGQRRPFLEGLLCGLVTGVGIGVVVGLLGSYDVGVGIGLAVGTAVWLIAWLTNGLESPLEAAASIGVLDSLARDRANTVSQSLMVGATMSVIAGTAFTIVEGDSEFADFLALTIFLGLPIGAVFAVSVGLKTAWGQWLVLTQVWMPLTGRLPWRLNAFLTDAHRRGVLRQIGPVYQFRHDRLKDALLPGRADQGDGHSHSDVDVPAPSLEGGSRTVSET